MTMCAAFAIVVRAAAMFGREIQRAGDYRGLILPISIPLSGKKHNKNFFRVHTVNWRLDVLRRCAVAGRETAGARLGRRR
jgi:hypothetical protein